MEGIELSPLEELCGSWKGRSWLRMVDELVQRDFKRNFDEGRDGVRIALHDFILFSGKM